MKALMSRSVGLSHKFKSIFDVILYGSKYRGGVTHTQILWVNNQWIIRRSSRDVFFRKTVTYDYEIK